jgi:hypothetical protein
MTMTHKDPLHPCPGCGVECLSGDLDLCPGCAADAAEADRLPAPGRDDDGAGLPAWDDSELPWRGGDREPPATPRWCGRL